MNLDYACRRLQRTIENINFGLRVKSDGFTIHYGCINSMAHREAIRNRNALIFLKNYISNNVTMDD